MMGHSVCQSCSRVSGRGLTGGGCGGHSHVEEELMLLGESSFMPVKHGGGCVQR